MKAAVIDLGTNTFHLLISEKNQDGSITELYRERRFVRLGKGGISQGVITDDAYQRAMSTLLDFKELIALHQVDVTRATATSAIRSARNGQGFMEEVKRKTGIVLEIISGDEEAELIFAGVSSDVEIGKETVMVMDIGGGSVEFIIGTDEGIVWKQSFEIGAQRLFDLFHHTEPIAPDSVKQLRAYLQENLAPLKKAIDQHQPDILIGSSGTFDTIWDMHFPKNEPREMDYAQFQQVLKPLLTKDIEERLLIEGMVPERVEMIVVACCLVDFIFTLMHPQKLQFAQAALKEGVLSKIFS